MKKILSLVAILLISGLFAACSNNAMPPVSHSSVKELKIIDTVIGDGNLIKNNHRVAVHYTGWLYDENAADKKGAKFDSSYDRRRPFVFSLGNKSVIEGWETGLLGMKTGGKRTLIIPPEMAYGAKGSGSAIPPNAALIFDIELLRAG